MPVIHVVLTKIHRFVSISTVSYQNTSHLLSFYTSSNFEIRKLIKIDLSSFFPVIFIYEDTCILATK